MKMADLIKPDLIRLTLNGTTKTEILKELVTLLDETGTLSNKEEFYKKIIERENEGHTGIGFGVAIPHGKSDAVNTPRIACGKKAPGIVWDEESGEKAEWIFMIAVPESQAGNEHLKILQLLASRLIDDSFRQQLSQSESREEVYHLLTK
ncbi:MAG: fructose PTS transporter subunit IIA [Thermoactinomyces sp.]